MKKNDKLTIALIIALALIAVFLLVSMVLMIKGKFHFGPHLVSEELIWDKTYENVYSTIEINSDASDIKVIATTDNSIRVVIYGDEKKTSVDETDSTLSITSKARKCFGLCFNVKISKIIVYLPAAYKDRLVVTNKYGDIDIDEFENADITVKEDCGNVEIKAANAVDVDNSYGNVTLGKVKTAKIKEDCGNVKIESVEEGTIKNSLGDVKIENVLGYVDIVEACGSIKIDDMVLTRDSSIKNSLGDITIGATNEIYIDASVSLGDVKINNNYRNAEVVLKLENNCGDIKVRN